MKRLITTLLFGLLTGGAGQVPPSVLEPPPRVNRMLPPGAEATYRAVSTRFDAARAMDVVTFMDHSWRVAGNPGFNESVDFIAAGLAAGGFVRSGARPADDTAIATYRIDEHPTDAHGWEPLDAALALVGTGGAADEIVLSSERDRITLCINSFSTSQAGAVGPLVRVRGGARSADYAGVDVRGAIVLGTAGSRALWEQAVRQRGALGVISTALEPYTRPDQTPDILQWDSIPYDAGRQSFGFKASPRARMRLEAALAEGPARLRVRVATRFHEGPARLLIAEIRGRERPGERIVLAAHIQEPGANDDASGCGTLMEVARSLAAAIASGALPRPARTVTFLWGDEMEGTRHWLRQDRARAAGVTFMMALDMTGENVTKTGGSFLIEKAPDPSAVWMRPSDPHTEWGGSAVSANALKGSVLNDVHLAVCRRRAEDVGWVVRTNPYEGGSDHTVFLDAHIPALLNWHFPDRYYHTNLDRPDMTSAAEMANVGISTATTAMLLGSGREEDAREILGLIAEAAGRRLDLERRQGEALVDRAPDKATARATETAVLGAWATWYREAILSVLQLPARAPSRALARDVAAARKKILS